MDEISHRRCSGGFSISRKCPGLVLRDTADNRDQNAQFCNRHGCNGRLKSMKTTQAGFVQKNKLPGSPIHFSSGKELVGGSSKTSSRVKNSKRTLFSPHYKGPSQIETVSSETSNVQDELDVLQLIRPAGKIQTTLHSAVDDAESCDDAFMEVGSSTFASKAKPQKNTNQKYGVGNHEPLRNSFVPLACRSTVSHGASSSRYNLRRSSTSDVNSSDCSLSELSVTKRKDVKKRISDGESSSSAKGKNISELSFEEKGKPSPCHGIAINDSRRSRNWLPSSRDNNVASVRTRKLTSDNNNSRTRFSSQRNINLLSSHFPAVTPQSEIVGSMNGTSLAHRFSSEGFNRRSNSCIRAGISGENARSIMEMGTTDVSLTRSLRNHDGMQCHNMDGIAEQLLVLETSLFLNGLPFHDQHRDMRLDIDNMTYEELLDLEEKMGTVSTALSEDELSTCLKRSIHQLASLGTQVMGCQADYDVKCSICQEEYLNGDDVGRLQCEHKYHMGCIQEWLRVKNWCPICKVSAVAPLPSS